MHVTELFQLTRWIDREIKTAQILQRYQRLQSAVQQNTKPDRPKQPFEEQKTDLISAIEKVPLETLSEHQHDFLKRIGIGNYVGSDAVAHVDDILVRNPIDPATAAQKLQQIVESMTQGIQRSDQLAASLGDIVVIEDDLVDRILIRVTFAHAAAINNVVDLKHWSGIWHEIGRGVAIINDASPEEVQVVGAGKGSIVMELAAGYAIARTISEVILQALRVAERVLDIRKRAEEIRGLKLANDKIAKELDDEADKEKSQGVEAIAGDVSKSKRKKDASDGDKIVAFGKAVHNLVGFLEKGGLVDCVVPDEAEKQAESEAALAQIKELKSNFRQIREIEGHLKQLEFKYVQSPDGSSESKK